MKPNTTAREGPGRPIPARLLIVANLAVAARVAAILLDYLCGQAWRLMLGLPLVLTAAFGPPAAARDAAAAAGLIGIAIIGEPPRRRGRARCMLIGAIATGALAGPARAETIVISFTGMTDGSPITSRMQGDWTLEASGPAWVIGPGNPSFAGFTGAVFGSTWEIVHDGGPVPISAIAVSLAPDSPGPGPDFIAGQASQGPGWIWSVSSAGVYAEDLGAYQGEMIAFGATAPGWHALGVVIETADPDPPALPEPSSWVLLGIGLAGSSGLRRWRRRKHRGPAEGGLGGAG